MGNKNSTGLSTGAIVAIIVGICILVGAIMAMTDDSSSSSNSKTCKSCNRSYTDSANTMSIAKTGMCKNCYGNFEWGMKATGQW